MNYNDMSIDYSNIAYSLGKINSSMRNIIEMADFLLKNARNISKSFDTVNYRNALEKVENVYRLIVNNADNVSKLNSYLKKLEEKVRQYENCRI